MMMMLTRNNSDRSDRHRACFLLQTVFKGFSSRRRSRKGCQDTLFPSSFSSSRVILFNRRRCLFDSRLLSASAVTSVMTMMMGSMGMFMTWSVMTMMMSMMMMMMIFSRPVITSSNDINIIKVGPKVGGCWRSSLSWILSWGFSSWLRYSRWNSSFSLDRWSGCRGSCFRWRIFQGILFHGCSPSLDVMMVRRRRSRVSSFTHPFLQLMI